MDAFEAFRIAFLIVSFNISDFLPLVSGESTDNCSTGCEGQTSYTLTGQTSMDVKMYYDSGAKLQPDSDYVRAVCKARKCFKKVTFSFVPGVRVAKNDAGTLECQNVDSSNKNCEWYYLDACAYKLLDTNQFANYVCCNYALDIGFPSVYECFEDENSDTQKMDQFVKCKNLQDETIKPADVLVANSQAAIAAFPNDTCYPYFSFNGQADKCARSAFLHNPEAVICAMLAQGVEDKCTT